MPQNLLKRIIASLDDLSVASLGVSLEDMNHDMEEVIPIYQTEDFSVSILLLPTEAHRPLPTPALVWICKQQIHTAILWMRTLQSAKSLRRRP